MPAPSTPTGFAFTEKGSTQGVSVGTIRYGAWFTWDEVAGVSYRMRIKVDGNWYDAGLGEQNALPYGGLLVTVSLYGGAHAVVFHLVESTTYEFQIRAESAAGISAWTTSLTWTTPTGYPPLVASANSGTFAVPAGVATIDSSDENGVAATADDAADYETAYEWNFIPIAGLGTTTIVVRVDGLHRSILVPLATPESNNYGGLERLRHSTAYLARVRAISGLVPMPNGALNTYLSDPAIAGDWSDDTVVITAPNLGLPKTVDAYVGSELSYALNASADTDAIVTSTLPAWLALEGSTLVGTPPDTGTHAITITATNDSGEDSGTLTIVVNVPGITLEFSADGETPWYSAAAALTAGITTVDQGQALSVTVRGVALGPVSDEVTVSITTGPGWLKQTGLVLAGTPPTAGEWNVVLHATNGTQTCDVTVKFVARSLVTPGGDIGLFSSGLPNRIDGWKDETLLEVAGYLGPCDVAKWILVGAPPGVALVELEICQGPYSSDGHRYIGIGGAPTQGGIFEATLVAQVCCDGVAKMLRATIQFYISGGLFLNWFHDDPSRRDMQVALRSMDVFSYCFEDELWMKRGDRVRFYLIFRDGPLPGRPVTSVVQDGVSNVTPPQANFGREPAAIDDITDVVFVVRLENDPEQKVLLKVTGTATTIAGRGVFVFDFDVSGGEMDAAIEVAGKQTKRPTVTLDCLGEFSWKNGGRQESSLECFVTIYQDLA